MKHVPAKRIAVVTGGSSGIGLSTVQQLAQDGYRVAFFGRNPTRVEAAAGSLISQYGETAIFHRCVDICDPTAITNFFTELRTTWGAPDTLVCNAGISPKRKSGKAAPFEKTPLDEWDIVLSTNLIGAVLCCQAVLPDLIANRFGRIILIGSIAGRTVPRIAGSAYTASKAALSGCLRSLIAATSGTGVTVNLIAPGNIITEMTDAPDSKESRAALARIPVGRLGEPKDVATVLSFLAREEAGFINGATIDVNGGEFAPL